MPVQTDENADFEFIIALIYERSRIRLHDGKHELIRSRLGKRIRHHGFDSFGAYCDYLRSSADEAEITHVIDALTTNFTQFLREKDHFEFLVQKALPEVLGSDTRRFNVWSAACATGEEPYTIAFYLSEFFPLDRGWDWRILATDVSTQALAKAQEGIYPQDRLQQVPAEWLRRHFQKGIGQCDGSYRIKSALGERISFRQLNLLGSYTFRACFDAIFCRNVMIYFDRATQEQLVRHMTRFLTPRGYLLIGHSESLTGLDLGLRCVRPSIYRKTD